MPTARRTTRKTRPAQARRRGTIVPKGDGKYLVRCFVGSDPRTGKRIYASRSVEGTISQAQRSLTRLLAEVEQGAYRAPLKQTLGAFLEGDWLTRKAAELKAGELSYRSLEGKRRAVAKLVRLGGALPLDKLTVADVERIRNELVMNYRPAAAAVTFDVLRSALRYARRMGTIPANPAEQVDCIKPPKPTVRALSLADTGRVLTAAGEHRDGAYSALIHVLLLGGLRPGEAFALRWADLEGSTLTVGRAVTKGASGTMIVGLTKTRTVRKVPLPELAVRVLEQHRQVQRIRVLQNGSRRAWEAAECLMFPNDAGGLRSIQAVREAWRAVLKLAGVSRIRLYAARHTYVTNLLQQGVDPRTVADLAGHSDPAITLRRYACATPASRSAAAAKLNAALSGLAAIRSA